MADFSQFFLGTPSRVEQLPRYTRQQQQLQNQSIAQVLSLLQGGMRPDTSGFQPIAQRARSQFAQQTVPTLAERFTSLGSNRISSPAFASQLGAAGAGLEEGLAALESQYGLQQQEQQNRLLSILLGSALAPAFENLPLGGQPGFAASAGTPILQGLGSLLPSMIQGSSRPASPLAQPEQSSPFGVQAALQALPAVAKTAGTTALSALGANPAIGIPLLMALLGGAGAYGLYRATK